MSAKDLRDPAKRSAGRPKGSKNILQRTIKDALEASFEAVGGVKWLIELAGKEPKAYAALLTKLIPQELHQQISGMDGRDLIMKIVLVDPEEKI